tara:strand:+ start:1964 stop:2767 length:804 start_codon:yes stop_codon:yes gene_type:complete
MGFIRGGLLFITGILLLVSFLAGNVFLTLALSITPENIQEQVVSNFDEISELAGENINLTKELEENFYIIEEYCVNNSDYVFSEQGYTIDISCDVVEQGPDAVMEEGINDIVDEFYYEDYSCDSFWKCFLNSENPLFLFSEQTKDYLKSKFYFSLFISLFLIAIMFFLVEQKTNLFLATGSLLIISSLPFIKVNTLLSFFNYSFLQFLPVLFSKAYFIFTITFITGIIILSLGIALKFFNIGIFITEKLDNFASRYKNSKEEIFKKK